MPICVAQQISRALVTIASVTLLLACGVNAGIGIPAEPKDSETMKLVEDSVVSLSQRFIDVAGPNKTKMVVEDGVVSLEDEAPLDENPYTIILRRESSPVKRNGKVVSFKTTYSGNIHVGEPAQQFRVVFDTGSGHVVLPSSNCPSPVCKIHTQYNRTLSETGVRINIDRSIVKPGAKTDMVTIAFGTGKVTGPFVQEKICMGTGDEAVDGKQLPNHQPRACAEVGFISAMDMSANPFGLFPFDGICGMGLSALALNPEFSFFSMLTQGKHVKVPHFGVFLTEGEEGENSELSVGGHNPARLASPLKWAKVPMADKGYWQVNIVAVHIGGHTLDVCKDGTCRAILDTGTSHIGVPAPHDQEVEQLLTRRAGDLLDCRIADAPEIIFELEGFNLTLSPHNYMRRLPLRNDVSVSTGGGVLHPNYTSPEENVSNVSAVPSKKENEALTINLTDNTSGEVVTRWCRPRMMPVRLPPPLGPKLFLLGEPLLHRYYTVFDWATPAIGFGIANNRRHVEGLDLVRGQDGRGMLPADVDVYLMQKQVTQTNADGDEMTMFQMDLIICVKPADMHLELEGIDM